MAKGLKYLLLIVLALQLALILVYYALKDKTTPIKWSIRNIFGGHNSQRNSTSRFSFWDMIGLGDNSQGSLTEMSTSEQYWETERTEQTISSVKRTEVKSGTTTMQTTSISPPKHSGNQHFQQIDDKVAWVYSAYFDYVAAQQGKPAVRVIGIFEKSLLQKLYCSFAMGNTSSHQVEGSASGLPESHEKKHVIGYILCSLPVGVRPTHVSISFQKNLTANNRLQIIYPGTLIRNFTVCYSVLHSGFNSSAQLIQSLEMNRILGAEHFMVYNYSISPDVDLILRRYQQDGLVTVLPWPVPTSDVHYFGQIAALNDCNFRNRNISRFVVIMDTDELLIPRHSLTWMELLDTISPEEYDVSAFVHPSDQSRKRLKTTGSFEFRSSFFTNNATLNLTKLPSQFTFSDEEKNNILKFDFLALAQFSRAAKIFPRHHRTKYIARPELVLVTGIHFVHSFVKGVSSVIVNDNLALVHHYRYSEHKSLVADTSILKFKNHLYPRLMQQCQRFPGVFT